VCPCHIIRDRRFGHFRIAFRGRYSPGARTGPEHVSESDERRRWASDLRKLLPSARSGQWATTTVFSSHTRTHLIIADWRHPPDRPAHPTSRTSSSRRHPPSFRRSPPVCLQRAVSAEPTRRARPPGPLLHAHVSCLWYASTYYCRLRSGRRPGTKIPFHGLWHSARLSCCFHSIPFHSIASLVSSRGIETSGTCVAHMDAGLILARCDARFCVAMKKM
jgi:hypothetical protein